MIYEKRQFKSNQNDGVQCKIPKGNKIQDNTIQGKVTIVGQTKPQKVTQGHYKIPFKPQYFDCHKTKFLEIYRISVMCTFLQSTLLAI